MSTAKIAISIDNHLLQELDLLVREKKYPTRSNIIQEAVREKLSKMQQNRLASECDKLNVDFEQSMAEEGFNMEIDSWPEY